MSKDYSIISDMDLVKVALIDVFSEIGISNIENDLRDILKADIGNDFGTGKHLHIDIGHKLRNITLVLAFLRKFPELLRSLDPSEFPELACIQRTFEEIDYDEVEEAFFGGLNQWIYQDDQTVTACIDFIYRISGLYMSVINLLRLCNDFYLVLYPDRR
jgi:hypothetical protein